MRRAGSSLFAGLLAGAAVLAVSSPVRAECPLFVIPPATEAAPSAREILVGTVIENIDGTWSDFRLRIDHVLRGPARVGEIRRFNRVSPGWPLTKTSDGTLIGPCEPLRALEGDVVALSLDALAPDGITRYNAESWLSGTDPYDIDQRRTTIAEMAALARIAAPATDTDALAVISPPSAPPSFASVLVLGAVAASVVLVISTPSRRKRSQSGF